MAIAIHPAERILASLELVDLRQKTSTDDTRDICANANNRHGPVAAVCVMPERVTTAALALHASSVRVSTVVNFPMGDQSASSVIDMTKAAIRDGAQEIDIVIPWKALIEGHPENVPARVARAKAAAGSAPVKAIIESGMLNEDDLIRAATLGAIDGGASFVAMASGTLPGLPSARDAGLILSAIRDSGASVGFKASGLAMTYDDACDYLALADDVMGPTWATPETFRIAMTDIPDGLLATLQRHAAQKSESEG